MANDNKRMDFKELKRQALARHLSRHIEGEVRFDRTSRRLYSTDASIYRMEPLGVVIPRSTEDVRAIVQIAAEMNVPVTARGGGTSLSGQSIGPGIVLDVSKYLHQILEIDRERRMARVQPGVVLDQLNRAAAPLDLHFGPDVATASRANLGGMIGNNSAGARSIVYGKTIDHVQSLQVVLASGELAHFGPLTKEEWHHQTTARNALASIYTSCRNIAKAHARQIQERFPRILRRVSGYNLDVLHDLFANGSQAKSGLHQLIIGSEGTLALVTEAELSLVPRPRYRGLIIPQFATLADAMTALAVCLEHSPSAVELMDHLLLQLTAQNLALRETMKAIQGDPRALLMVELSGDEPGEIEHRAERLRQRLGEVPGVTAIAMAMKPEERDPLWNLRKAAMPLLYSMPGDSKPITFVEDTAVSPDRLPEYVARFREILQRHDTDGAFYGHASVGCLHIRPVLNLKDPEHIVRMRQIASEVADLVVEHQGSLSGEHGDGMVRSEWLERMFGPSLIQAFRHIKRAFDPNNLLNPGKIVDPAPMTEHLRYEAPCSPTEPFTLYDYQSQNGFVRSIEMCNGNGACRKREGGTMCPSYRATLDEKDSTRGRANLLRLALAQDGEMPLRSDGKRLPLPRAMQDKDVLQVLDLCLMCKACKSECPSNVDMAKIKAEFLQQYYSTKSRPIGHKLMGHIHRLNRIAAPVAPLVNWLQNRKISRWLLEKIGGIDRRRSLPKIHFHHFRRWFARHKPAASAGRNGKVLLLDDCFTTWNEPGIGQSAVNVLEQAGYEVELAGLVCCGRALLSKGFVREAKDLISAQAGSLRQRIDQGLPLLGLEPSCLLTLADDWQDLVPGAETRAIAQSCYLTEEWLARQCQQGELAISFRSRKEEHIFHGHCHQKALQRQKGTVAALSLIPDLSVDVLDAGCCGMAGSFGFEKEHYDISVNIANLALLPALSHKPETTVIAPGTSCRHQILDLDGRTALHPIQILEEQISSG